MRWTRRVIVGTVLGGLVLGGTAMAEERTAVEGMTRLHVSGSASAELQQSLLVATLAVEHEDPDPIAVQRQINARMTEAVAAAGAVAGLQVRTGGYSVWPLYEGEPRAGRERPRRYRGSQSLELRGEDAPALLELVGQLQAKGLVMRGLDYRVTVEAEAAARKELTEAAFADLRDQAQRAAAAMGLQLAGWAELRLGGDAPIQPRMRAMAMEAAADMAPPVAVPGTERITLTVDGTALLRAD
jgi:predicted secreted protein